MTFIVSTLYICIANLVLCNFCWNAPHQCNYAYTANLHVRTAPGQEWVVQPRFQELSFVLGMLCWALTSPSETVRGMHCSMTEAMRVLSRGKTYGVVQSDKIPEAFGSIISGTRQGPGLGLGFGYFFISFLLFSKLVRYYSGLGCYFTVPSSAYLLCPISWQECRLVSWEVLEAVLFRTFQRMLEKIMLNKEKSLYFAGGWTMSPSKFLLDVPFVILWGWEQDQKTR